MQDTAILLSNISKRVQMLGLKRRQVGDLLIAWDFSLQIDFDEVCKHGGQLDYKLFMSTLFFVQ